MGGIESMYKENYEKINRLAKFNLHKINDMKMENINILEEMRNMNKELTATKHKMGRIKKDADSAI